MPNDLQTQSTLNIALDIAKKLGATEADVALNTEKGFSITVRNQDVETLEHHLGKGLAVTVFRGKAKGSASTSDLSEAAIQSTIEKALTIAKNTGEDPDSGLPDKADLATTYPDCDLYHPWNITPEQAIQKGIDCEQIALAVDKKIKQVESVEISTIDAHFMYANSLGFMGEYKSSSHSISASVIAEDDNGMQRDYEYASSRVQGELQTIDWVATTAAEKTVKRLSARKIKTQTCPVLFDPQMTKSILSSLIGAISGGSQYRQTSFLLDAMGKLVLPEKYSLFQTPHLKAAAGSQPFDGEGVLTRDLHFIEEGVVKNYLLSSYSARKLGMKTTGSAGGIYNLNVTNDDLNFKAMLKKMDRGLLVTELMGQGVNMISGDYSRGAFGFWVEGGEIQFPVEEITIAGNLKDMLMNVVAMGNDLDLRGNYRVGSMLIEAMKVGGD